MTVTESSKGAFQLPPDIVEIANILYRCQGDPDSPQVTSRIAACS